MSATNVWYQGKIRDMDGKLIMGILQLKLPLARRSSGVICLPRNM